MACLNISVEQNTAKVSSSSLDRSVQKDSPPGSSTNTEQVAEGSTNEYPEC